MAREWPTEGGAQEINVGTFDFPASTGTFFIACWVWFDAMGSTDIRFYSKASGTAQSQHTLMLGTNFSGGNDILRCRAFINSLSNTFLSTNSALTGLTNQWVHCAARYDGSNVTLWVNGVDVTSTTYSRTGNASSGNGNTVYIGNQPGSGGSSNALNGRLADMIVTAYSPTNAEIAALASGLPHSRLLGRGATLGYWPLLGQSTEPDYSGNGHNGTVDAGITIANNPPIAPLFGFDEPYSAFAAAAGGNTETLAAVASGVASLDRQLSAGRTLAGTATGIATLTRLASFFRDLSATATGIATLVAESAGEFFETIAAVATGVAGVNRRLLAGRSLSATATGAAAVARTASLFRTLSATATGVATLVGASAGQFFEAIAAVATGVANLDRRISVSRALAATAVGSAAVTLGLSLSRTLSATATGVAGVARRLSILKTLPATATGVALLAAGRLYNVAIAAIATAAATLTAVFTEKPEEPTTPFSGDAGIRMLGRSRWRVRRPTWRRRR